MTRPLIAVVGTGSIGMRHLQALETLGAGALAVPIRPDRRKELEARGLSCARNLEEARRMGARGSVVATDTGRHPQDALAAVELGLPVLCEKPLAATCAEAARLRPALDARGVGFFVALCLRFSPTLRRLEERLPEAGEVHSVRGECRSYLPGWRPDRDYRRSYAAREGEGGVILDLIHDVDLAVRLFGVPRRVHGTAANLGRLGIQTEEMAEAAWQVTDGPQVSLALDYLSRSPVRFIRAAGDRGEVVGDFVGNRVLVKRAGGREDVLPAPAQDMYLEQMRAFLEVVGGGSPGRLASFEEGMRDLSVCEAWKKSARTGMPEEVLP